MLRGAVERLCCIQPGWFYYGALVERGAADPVPLQLAGRISSRAARRYHLIAVSPLDLGGMLAADRP